MNTKRRRAKKKQRRYCNAALRTRTSNGLSHAKVIYDTEEDAWDAIRATTRDAVITLEEMTPYLCRATKDHYHTGRRAKKHDTAHQQLLDTLKQIPGAAKILRNT